MAHAPTAALERRHQRIRRELSASQLDAIVVTALPNIQYLTNFSGSSAIVVLTQDRLLFITDFRYLTAVDDLQRSAHACPGLALVRVESAYDATLATALVGMSGARVGLEAAHLSLSRFRWLEATLSAATARPSLVETSQVVERARMVKDDYELGVLREAARRLSAAANRVLGEVRAGVMERDLAFTIDVRLREAGFERPAFDTIVAAGPNGALPHAHPGERRLSENDLVVLDFGGVYDSYCVDLTRTVSLGRADGRAQEVYAAVLEAHDSAIRSVQPGRLTFDIDAAARDVLAGHGMAEAFGHSTGHGLGLEVHEEPRIARRRAEDVEKQPVEPGMVFTIEPGAYFPGWGGVRIEDDVVVTDRGVEVLTEVTTDLLEL